MSGTKPLPGKRPIRAFLSHRYGSPAVNLRFFDLFSRAAQVQFSVDFGELATNVTRLERLVRDADAFIGLYPLDVPALAETGAEELRKQSRYFRLELDLAIRAGIPTIVFVDQRYGRQFECPDWTRKYSFDPQEIASPVDGPGLEAHAKAFQVFSEGALAYQGYRLHQAVGRRERNTVGLLLPANGYGRELRRKMAACIEDGTGRRVVDLGWPPRLGGPFYASIGELDWVVVDVGDNLASGPAVGFLHGHFVPAVRLARSRGGAAAAAISDSLYGAFEVGYPKDIVRWSEPEALLVALLGRLKTLMLPQQLVDDVASARRYFESASLRKEVVFVSYSGADLALARPIIEALKKKFKTVFDYKDGESIRPGRPWLEEIFGTIARASGGVALLSPNYLASGNCLHEAREMVARRDEGRLQLLPVRLTAGKLDLPEWLLDTQHARLDPSGDVQEVPKLLGALLTG